MNRSIKDSKNIFLLHGGHNKDTKKPYNKKKIKRISLKNFLGRNETRNA